MNNSEKSFAATTVTSGNGSGHPIALSAALSFWGGFDSEKGTIVEPGHPQFAQSIAGKVMLIAHSKGSSSSSSVLAEAIRNGTGPVAIVMLDRDLIVALGAIVAAELYGKRVPIVTVSNTDWATLVALGSDSTISITATEDMTATVVLS